MQISSVGSSPYTAQISKTASNSEARERGPDTDGDADDRRSVTAAALSSPPPGRGQKLNIVA